MNTFCGARALFARQVMSSEVARSIEMQVAENKIGKRSLAGGTEKSHAN
jgi:hypothetical protein